MSFFKLLFYSIHDAIGVITRNDITAYNKVNNLKISSKANTLRILGNGESLKELLNELGNTHVDYLVVNRYVLSESYSKLKPAYYTIMDPHFFNNEEGLKIMNLIKNQTTWEMFLFFPYGHFISKRIKSYFNDIPNIRLVFVNVKDFNGFKFIKTFLYNHNLSIPRIQNVIVASIYVGISLKYKNIELYGVEHSWTKLLSVNEDNQVCLENPHFFDIDKSTRKTWYEIHNQCATLSEVLRMYANMFESYFELQGYSKIKNIKIWNCTKNSFIDAFERK